MGFESDPAAGPPRGRAMIALVTGGGGFLGRYIVEQLLARGDHVRSLSRKQYPELAEQGVELIRGDVRDPSTLARAVKDAEVVYHVAGIAGIYGAWTHYHDVNRIGTERLIHACWKHQVPRLVYTSSPSVTFDGCDQRNVDESVGYPRRWLSHYSHSKAMAERAVLASNGRHGLLTCALRPHLIWGPRDQHLIPRLLTRARAGQLRRVGRGKNQIDITYVENAASSHLQAADALADPTRQGHVAGKAYFISQGSPVNCWDWINEILELDGQAPVSKSVPATAAWCIGGLLEKTHHLLRNESEPRMTRFLAAQLSTSHYFDIRAAKEDFGYSVQVSTSEGMQRLAEWLRAAKQRNP